MHLDPLHQFEIKKFFNISIANLDISYTNSSLWMSVGLIVSVIIFHFGLKKENIMPNRLQALCEIIFNFLYQMIKNYIGNNGLVFFPFIFCLFWFVLMGNLLGLVPFSFTYTSHIIVTITLALSTFLVANIMGILKHKSHYFSLFAPKGVPKFLLPLMVLIEIISYLARPLSLSIRLFANMMAGHLILKLFGGFCALLLKTSLATLAIVPLVLNTGIFALEFLVAILQTYVFTLLTCMYINDAINLH